MNIEPNIFFWIILVAVVGIFILDLFSEWLNIKGLRLELPQEFKDVFDQEKYSKSLEYTHVTTKFGAVQSSFDLIIFLLFWIVGGFGWLSNIIIDLGHGPVTSGLLFFSTLFIAAGLMNLPFEIYDTFKIEAKFGFNKTTRSTFIGDKIKGLFLGALIGLPVLGLIIWLFESFENAWLWGWIFLSGFSLLMAYLAPAVILPLFNKFEPLEEGELKSAINDMAETCKFPLTELSVMDGSKRSSKSNAFFTGFGKNKKIALYDTLIANHSTSELVAVLAHEIGHFKKKHIMQTLFLGIAQTGILFFVLGFFIRSEPLSSAFGVNEPSVYCSLLFFTLLFKPISKILSVLMNILSRKNEFEADAYAADVTGNADSLITALKKLSADNLSNLTPHPFYVFMHYSHPPVSLRIKELRKVS
ncbi:MAG: M48 family metallopeptidase [Verrucomicrobiales bacterium]|nr:M48 family metallopeptidase [Verrucomicrobiales bacterium]